MSDDGETGRGGGGGLSVEDLERWVLFGARWRAVEVGEDRAVVDLCQCTGELVERRVAEDPAVIAYVREAGSAGEPD